MAKISGIPSKVSIDNSAGSLQDISGDITSFTNPVTRETQDSTGLDKGAFERLLLRADGKLQINGIVNTDANMSHAVLSDAASTSVIRSVEIVLPPTTTGAPKLPMEMALISYNVARAQNGALTFTADFELADGTAPTWTVV